MLGGCLENGQKIIVLTTVPCKKRVTGAKEFHDLQLSVYDHDNATYAKFLYYF